MYSLTGFFISMDCHSHTIHAKPAPGGQYYTICFAPPLDASWSDWFDGMSLSPVPGSQDRSVLSGYVRDQAELYGILNKLRSLNLTLLSVQGPDSPRSH